MFACKPVTMVRDKLNKRELEEQRKQAVEVLERGYDPTEVADIFHVKADSIRQWQRTYEEEGMEGLEGIARGKESIEEYKPLPERTRKELAARRKEAIRALRRGFTVQEISGILNIQNSTVREWREAYKTDGVESLEPKAYNGKFSRRINDISADFLRELLPQIEDAKTAQQVMLSLNYKQEIISQQSLAERYGLNRHTVKNWLCHIERLEDKSVEELTCQKKDAEEVETDITAPERTRDELGARRKEAVRALERGFQAHEVADFFDVSAGSVSNWKHTYNEEGMAGLEPIPRVGKRDTSTRLKNVSESYLREVLSHINGAQASRRVRMAIDYKHEKHTSQTEIANRYGVAQSTLSNWLSRIENLVEEESTNVKAVENIAIELDTSSMNYLENTDNDELKVALKSIGEKPTQRLICAILYKEGFTAPTIADWFDVKHKTICNWFGKIETKPIIEAVQENSHSGRSTKLSKDKFSELEESLQEGAGAHGFTGQIWTGDRVAKLIEQEFDVSVSGSTARSYLKRLGWSNQKPEYRSVEWDKATIDEFVDEKWPNILKRAKKDERAIVFVDETKFRLLPTFKKTWAPKGERPVVEAAGLFEFIAVIGALSYVPQTKELDLQWRIQRYGYETESVFSFLCDLRQDISQSTLFILDNWSVHKSTVKKLKKEEIINDVGWFPEYASDINPVDNVWGQAKYNELSNYTPKDLDELEQKVNETLSDIQDDDSVLRYCIKDAGLEIEA